MNPLSEVVQATVKLFRQYAKGQIYGEAWGKGTLNHAAYRVLRDSLAHQEPYELVEFSQQLREALTQASLNEHKQSLADINLAAFVPSEDVDRELILLRWRMKLGTALAELTLHRWPSLRKYYPKLF